MKYTLIALTIALTGCSNIETKEVLDAVQLGPDECGRASITGDLSVGSNPIISTTVHVNIDKEKRTYTDSAGNVQSCQ